MNLNSYSFQLLSSVYYATSYCPNSFLLSSTKYIMIINSVGYFTIISLTVSFSRQLASFKTDQRTFITNTSSTTTNTTTVTRTITCIDLLGCEHFQYSVYPSIYLSILTYIHTYINMIACCPNRFLLVTLS